MKPFFKSMIPVRLITSLPDCRTESVSSEERVATYATASSRVKRFFDNLLFFLSLVSVFTLLLAGIGMQSSLAALLRRKEKSFAILRSLGSHRFIFTAPLSGYSFSA